MGKRETMCNYQTSAGDGGVRVAERAVLVYITTPGEEDAARIGRALVERRLAGCANIVPRIRSVYRWEGKVEEAGEALLLVKSTRAAAPRVIEVVRALHSDEVPAVSVLPIEQGNPDYISWLVSGVQVADQ